MTNPLSDVLESVRIEVDPALRRWFRMAVTKQDQVRGSRVAGDQRIQLAAEYRRRYEAGASIRSIAGESGRSYGFVQGLLKETGVSLRGRGGATRGRGRE